MQPQPFRGLVTAQNKVEAYSVDGSKESEQGAGRWWTGLAVHGSSLLLVNNQNSLRKRSSDGSNDEQSGLLSRANRLGGVASDASTAWVVTDNVDRAFAVTVADGSYLASKHLDRGSEDWNGAAYDDPYPLFTPRNSILSIAGALTGPRFAAAVHCSMAF